MEIMYPAGEPEAEDDSFLLHCVWKWYGMCSI